MFNKKQLFGLNVMCAVAYILGASIGRLLAFPPSGVSPIWPAAGVALAVLLLHGKKILPGLFLGAFAAQTFSFFDGSSTESLINSLVIGSLISFASCLQALLAVWLIHRFVTDHNLLIKDSAIIRFLMLGGPVSCLITASLSTAILRYIHAIPLNAMLSNWLTWWVGDTMGVLIFTPLLLICFAKPREIWQSRWNYVFYPLSMLLLLVFAIFHYTKQQEEQQITSLFNQQANLLSYNLSHEFNSHIAINEELKSFFDNSALITQTEFHYISKTILNQHPSIEKLAWAPRISDRQRANFEKTSQTPAAIRELGKHDNLITATQRNSHFPLAFVEPIAGNERAVNVDITTNPIALQALLKAQDSGQTMVTIQTGLIQNTEKTQNLVIYSPVYDKNKPSQTQQQKRQALQGFIVSELRIGTEVLEAKSEIPPQSQLLIKIVEADTILYSDFPTKSPHKLTDINLYKQSVIKVADRSWQVSYRPSEKFLTQHQSWERWSLLSSCLLFTSLTSVTLLMLTGRTLRTEELVKTRTLALHKEATKREEYSRVLHALVVSRPLTEVLKLIVKTVEDEDIETECSILLLDDEGKHLKHAASGRLPDFYTAAIDGAAIGDGVGSCGTAAFLGKRVIVSDINKHPYWQNFRALAQQAGLAACWSEPIMSSEHQVLGTFAIYFPTPKLPNKAELQKIEEFAKLASLAIEKSKAEEKIRSLAFYDTLTQLPNRRLLNDRLNRDFAYIERNKGYGALMFLDLDHFKTLNDSLGHHIGDELLIQVAARLKECVRDEDTVARLGGDEFVVLQTAVLSDSLEQASDRALTIAKRIQKTLRIPYSLQGYEHYVTSSIGITLFGKENKNIDTLFKQADTAMYAAKSKGRNTFSFYNEKMQHHADKRLELERDLIIALNTQQFKLYYQPQYDNQGMIISAEALLRWEHPEKGLVNTADFISACEESGLILAIGEWVLKGVCQQLLKWPTLQYIAVNIGLRQFHQPAFVQQVADVLEEYQIAPHLLMLEATEKAIIKESTISIEKLIALQSLGVRIALDDFGVGYSSVTHLKSLPIDQIKIDQQFIWNMSNDSEGKVIVEIIVMIAKQLGWQIVAEGVETSEQLKFLQGMGCNIYQGYYFNKPLAADEFDVLLGKVIKPE